MELRRGGGAVVLQQQALYTQVEAGGLLLAGPAPNLLPAPAALVLLFSLLGPRLTVLLARVPEAVGGPVEVGAVAVQHHAAAAAAAAAAAVGVGGVEGVGGGDESAEFPRGRLPPLVVTDLLNTIFRHRLERLCFERIT